MTVQTKPKPEFAPGTTAALESEPRTNGQLVTQPAQVMRQSAPSSLAAALLQAQEQCQPVPLDALNARKKPYPTAEAIYAVASEALKGTGLVTFPLGHMPADKSDVTTAGKEWLLLVCKWELQHVGSGEIKTFTGCWPVLFEKGRTVEDAFKMTLTRSMSGFFWELLRMRRGEPTPEIAAECAAEARRSQPKQYAPQPKQETKPQTQSAPAQPANGTPPAATPYGPELLTDAQCKTLGEKLKGKGDYCRELLTVLGISGLRALTPRWVQLVETLATRNVPLDWFRSTACGGKRFCDLDEQQRIAACTTVLESAIRT